MAEQLLRLQGQSDGDGRTERTGAGEPSVQQSVDAYAQNARMGGLSELYVVTDV